MNIRVEEVSIRAPKNHIEEYSNFLNQQRNFDWTWLITWPSLHEEFLTIHFYGKSDEIVTMFKLKFSNSFIV